MANSLRRILSLATLVLAILAIMFANTDAQDGGPPGGGGSSPADAAASTDSDSSGDDEAPKDFNGYEVTKGVIGHISPVFWPFQFGFLQVLNTALRLFFSQELPCTIWSITPPKIQCEKAGSLKEES